MTPSQTIKKLHRAEKKKAELRGKYPVSLKDFAKRLEAEGNEVVKSWRSNKKGSGNAQRKPENLSRARMEATATRSARRKKGAAPKE